MLKAILLDNGEPVRCQIIDEDRRRNFERIGTAQGFGFGVELRHQLCPVGQGVLDIARQPVQLPLFAERPTNRILDQEVVDRHAIAARMDARIDDVAAGQMDRASDTVKQSGVVGRIYRHQCRAAFRIIAGVNGEIGVLIGEQMLRIAGDDVGRLGNPIGIGQALC